MASEPFETNGLRGGVVVDRVAGVQTSGNAKAIGLIRGNRNAGLIVNSLHSEIHREALASGEIGDWYCTARFKNRQKQP